jgi:hypothetical protein
LKNNVIRREDNEYKIKPFRKGEFQVLDPWAENLGKVTGSKGYCGDFTKSGTVGYRSI